GNGNARSGPVDLRIARICPVCPHWRPAAGRWPGRTRCDGPGGGGPRQPAAPSLGRRSGWPHRALAMAGTPRQALPDSGPASGVKNETSLSVRSTFERKRTERDGADELTQRLLDHAIAIEVMGEFHLVADQIDLAIARI